jgi:hypothetical protein
MVKAPLPGTVKTRLSRQIGSTEALRFYRVTTDRLIRNLARDKRWQLVLAVSPDNRRRAKFWPASLPRVAQGAGGLGVRMIRLLQSSPGRPIALIGSDIPGIRACHVASALKKITGANLVLGPAGDGGFLADRKTCAADAARHLRWRPLVDRIRDGRHHPELGRSGRSCAMPARRRYRR